VRKETDIAQYDLKILKCPYCIMQKIKFLKTRKYSCSFTYSMVETSTVCTGDRRKDVS
jgi:protein-arginine kinase activator protein McsA